LHRRLKLSLQGNDQIDQPLGVDSSVPQVVLELLRDIHAPINNRFRTISGMPSPAGNGRLPRGIGTVKYPRVVAKDDQTATLLKKRTLTNLYNKPLTSLANVHRKLDEAVFAAYGWSPALSDDELLAKLLELNLSRAGMEAAGEGSDVSAI